LIKKWTLGAILLAILILGCDRSKPKETEEKTGSSSLSAKPVLPDKSLKIEENRVAKAYFGPLDHNRVNMPFKINKAEKPSVILIVIDAFAVKHLSTYGYSRKTTPNIDALASRGLILTNYIANAPWTRPSFTTIITGLTKKQHGVELSGKFLDKSIVTIADRFKSSGYKTAAFIGNPLIRAIWGYNSGYDLFEDATSMKKAFPPDSWLSKRAIAWLKKVKDKPFFLQIFFTAPHVPYRPLGAAKHFVKQFDKGNVIEYPFREYKVPVNEDDRVKTIAAYDDEIHYADEQVGKIVSALREFNIDSNTAIIITADHGEMLGEHNCFGHAYHMWEQTLRVPFIMFLPWHKLNNLYDDRPYTHVDMVPTLLDIAGIKNDDKNLSGISVLKQLASAKDNRKRIIYSQYNAHGIRRQSVRKYDLKLIHHDLISKEDLDNLNNLHPEIPSANPWDLPSLATKKPRYEFYNIKNDPKEQKNLLKNNPDSAEFRNMAKILSSFSNDDVDGGQNSKIQLSDEMIKALTAAGYFVPASSGEKKKKKKNKVKKNKNR
jgi:arylsulfatase A-like enzyme